MENLQLKSQSVKLNYTQNIIPFNKICVEFNYIVKNNFGELLKNLRKAKDLSQADLALRVGATKSYISKLEKNQIKQPRLDKIEKICKVFDFSFEEAKKILFLQADANDSENNAKFSIDFGDEVRVSMLHGAGMNEDDQKEFVSAFNVAYQIAKQRIADKKEVANWIYFMRRLIQKASKYEINIKPKDENDFYFICASEKIEIIWSDGKFSWFMTVDGQPFIVLPKKKRGLKLLFDMFHELGHYFGHCGDEPNQVFFSGLSHDKREMEADAFATVCLIPEDKIDSFELLEDHPIKFARQIYEDRKKVEFLYPKN